MAAEASASALTVKQATALVPWNYPLKAIFFCTLWRDKNDGKARCSTCRAGLASLECASCAKRWCDKCDPKLVPSSQDLAAEMGTAREDVGFHCPLALLILCQGCLAAQLAAGSTRDFTATHPQRGDAVPILRMARVG